MKTLYITSKTRISFDEREWYINNEPQKKDEADDVKKLALEKMHQVANRNIAQLLSHFQNIAVLTAAGTSMDNGDNSGKTRGGLWTHCNVEIEKIKAFLESKGVFNDRIKREYEAKDIEHFLSFLLLYEKISQDIVDENGVRIINELEKKIASACTLKLDGTNKHHGDFITKLTARKPSEPRLQFYTTNYDTLFEQAAHERGYTIIDGFSFSYPRAFNGINFDYDIVHRDRTRIKNEESFVPNVFQLYKIHGSVDWEKREDGKIYQTEKIDSPCIVYPASNKYESSYEQPYFEMMSHFQQTMRKEGTLLIVVGFGFADKHIQNVIKDAVNQNSNFHLLVVCYGLDDGLETGITKNLVPDYLDDTLKVPANVSVIFSRFKDFVDIIPVNYSYTNEFNDEAI